MQDNQGHGSVRPDEKVARPQGEKAEPSGRAGGDSTSCGIIAENFRNRRQNTSITDKNAHALQPGLRPLIPQRSAPPLPGGGSIIRGFRWLNYVFLVEIDLMPSAVLPQFPAGLDLARHNGLSAPKPRLKIRQRYGLDKHPAHRRRRHIPRQKNHGKGSRGWCGLPIQNKSKNHKSICCQEEHQNGNH